MILKQKRKKIMRGKNRVSPRFPLQKIRNCYSTKRATKSPAFVPALGKIIHIYR